MPHKTQRLKSVQDLNYRFGILTGNDDLNVWVHNQSFGNLISFWECQNFLEWDQKQLFTTKFYLLNTDTDTDKINLAQF